MNKILYSFLSLSIITLAPNADFAYAKGNSKQNAKFFVFGEAPESVSDPRGENIIAIFVAYNIARSMCDSGVAKQETDWLTEPGTKPSTLKVSAEFSCIDARNLPCEPSVSKPAMPQDREPPNSQRPFPPGKEPADWYPAPLNC